MIDLSGRAALVTGGSRGIGRATSLLLARAGADVAITYRLEQRAAESVVAEIGRLGRGSLALQGDLSRHKDAGAAVRSAVEALGRLDILVNNHGIWKDGPIETMTEDEWDETLDVNLKGVFLCTQAAVPVMKRQRYGRIINIASTAGQRGEAMHSHYAASKGGIISFTKSLGPELCRHGILVNCVAPGWVDTDMSAAALAGEEREKILGTIPLGRPGTPEEIAGGVLFFASELAGYCCGEVLNVNGGSVLCG
ncbi:MAG TPA: 3-oxoacyl-ACP reductase family protein [Candidatus Polarisedimenticolia bacterium]|jgi:3-oxoacyl-[acyl-carrier protein] reductase|nr:3-oxoacyl-ACP reductase family protein [Candidatus Polarisedimenticolia bacterium]